MKPQLCISHALNAALATMAAAALALGSLTFIPALFGYSTYVVRSASMTPAIPLGSLAIVDRSVQGENVGAGDIIAFRIDDADESVCVHRAQDIDQKGGLVQTKGDANDAPDLRLVPFEEIVGAVRAHVPCAGWAIVWLESNRAACVGTAVSLALAATALSLASSRNIRRKTEKKGTTCQNRPGPHPKEA